MIFVFTFLPNMLRSNSHTYTGPIRKMGTGFLAGAVAVGQGVVVLN